jgi:ComF family protein
LSSKITSKLFVIFGLAIHVLLALLMLQQVLFRLLYPPYCVGCQKLGSHICQNCLKQLEPLMLQPDFPFTEPAIYWHAIYTYQRPLDSLIKSMKYNEVTAIASTLAQLAYLAFPPWSPQICTAVPMHPAKQRQRGFNQAELIAQQLAKLLQIPYQPLLKKTINTRPQASLSQTARLNHYRPDTFRLLQPITQPDILLIDDVITTGATMQTCAQTLLKAGAQRVFCLGLAHSLV